MRPHAKTTSRLRRLVAVALAAFGAACAASCLSPTLPLPPPELPQTLVDRGDGTWGVQGTCIPGAEVIVFNQETGRGVAEIDRDESGAYHLEIEAELCDFLTIEQSFGGETSGKSGFILEPLSQGLPPGPSVCAENQP